MAARERSAAQRARQSREHRNGGQYAKVNPCNCCGKSAGVNYYSDSRTDVIEGFSDFICLCRKCCAAGEKIADPDAALRFYASGGKDKPGSPEANRHVGEVQKQDEQTRGESEPT